MSIKVVIIDIRTPYTGECFSYKYNRYKNQVGSIDSEFLMVSSYKNINKKKNIVGYTCFYENGRIELSYYINSYVIAMKTLFNNKSKEKSRQYAFHIRYSL